MNTVTVLMTGVGGPGAGGYIYSLKFNHERNIRIVGTDLSSKIDPSTMDSLDAFYQIPPANTEAYLSSLLKICQNEHVSVLLPLNTIELSFLSSHSEEFEQIGTTVCVLPFSQLQVVNDKVALLTTMQSLGIHTPAFRVITSLSEFEMAAKELGYPEKAIVIKRPDANGSRGMRFIDANVSRVDLYLYSKPHSTYSSYEEMVDILPEALKKTKLLVMELLPGQEYSVDTMVNQGAVIRSVCRRVDVVIDSINVDSTIVQHRAVLDYCDEISKKLKINGFVGYDLKMDSAGVPQILEINPRLQATTILSVLGGVNYPYAIVKKALGEKVELPEPKEGIRTMQRKQKLFFAPDGSLMLKL